MYCLKYYSGERLIETVMSSNPLPLVKWKKKKCFSAYKNGKLKIEKV